jgi:hypothetical protein
LTERVTQGHDRGTDLRDECTVDHCLKVNDARCYLSRFDRDLPRSKVELARYDRQRRRLLNFQRQCVGADS